MFKKWKQAAVLAAIGAIAFVPTVAFSSASQSATRRVVATRSTPVVSIVTAGEADEGDGIVTLFLKFLRASGIRANEVVIGNAASGLRVVISGQANFDVGDPTLDILAVSNGHVHIQYLATDAAATDYVILARPGLTLKNLSGATLGVESPSLTGATVAEAALKKAGVNLAKIHEVTIGDTGARVTALLAGKIDLAPVLAPSAIPAIATGKAKLLLNAGATLGPFLQQGLIGNESYVTRHKALVQKVVNAMLAAGRYAATNENGYIEVVNAAGLRNGLTISQERQVWLQLKKAGYFAPNGAVCPSQITSTLDIEFETGTLLRSQVPARSVWLNPSFVQSYLVAHHQSANTC